MKIIKFRYVMLILIMGLGVYRFLHHVPKPISGNVGKDQIRWNQALAQRGNPEAKAWLDGHGEAVPKSSVETKAQSPIRSLLKIQDQVMEQRKNQVRYQPEAPR